MLERIYRPHCVRPCKEYSRLKMRPGGPPALRTPTHMDGLPGLSPAQLQKLETAAKSIDAAELFSMQ